MPEGAVLVVAELVAIRQPCVFPLLFLRRFQLRQLFWRHLQRRVRQMLLFAEYVALGWECLAAVELWVIEL